MPSPAKFIGTTAAVAWLAATLMSVVTADAPSQSTTSPVSAVVSADVPVVGLSGCAARGCHGGPTVGPDGNLLTPTDHNACSYWQRYDRHADAYRVLFDDRSTRMVELLAAGGEVVPAHEQQRCLACHTMPVLAAAEPTPEVLRLRAEGVSCDACHTTPGRSTNEWIDPHKKGWTPAAGVDWYAKHGLNYLGTSADRARNCAGCHVGAAASPETNIPLREVNHDLIAAGHPRLNFEYATYLALMPPHWSGPSYDRTGTPLPTPPPGRDVLEWYVGQLETAAAGLDFLADQATRPNAVWPEFSAFDCYACHFEIIRGTTGRE